MLLKLSFYDFVPDISRLAEAMLVLLRQESSCQQIESDGEDDGDIDHDEVLMDAVSDLLPAFAKMMGSYFEPIFAKLFDPLMKFAVCNSSLSIDMHMIQIPICVFPFLLLLFRVLLFLFSLSFLL